MAIIQIIIATIISTGVITALISHWYDKKLRTHEIKLQKYFGLIEELAKLAGNATDHDNLRRYFNEALLFASDDVVREILKFNKIFTQKMQTRSEKNVQMEAKDLEPLIVAIRGDLYLKSRSIIEEGLRFFQKP